MKKILIITLLFYFCCAPKPLGVEFTKFNGYYFFMNPVKELSKFGINESDKILFAKFDQEKASIELISGESWKVVNILQLKKYKDNIFELSNFSDLYIHLRYSGENFGQHSLRFIREKDNTDSMLIYGYFVYELKSIADCKKYAKDWQDEANESNCKKESCYGN